MVKMFSSYVTLFNTKSFDICMQVMNQLSLFRTRYGPRGGGGETKAVEPKYDENNALIILIVVHLC